MRLLSRQATQNRDLDDIETFYMTREEAVEAGESEAGWYWWLPSDGEPIGPFDSEQAARKNSIKASAARVILTEIFGLGDVNIRAAPLILEQVQLKLKERLTKRRKRLGPVFAPGQCFH